MSDSYIHVRREGGSECRIDLVDLEGVLDGFEGREGWLIPDSGKVLFLSTRPDWLDEDDEEADPDKEARAELAANPGAVQIDPISSRTRFGWMEEFIDTVHSITVQTALRKSLRQKKPFRHFKDALLEYPALREQWFQFEAVRVRTEAVALLESFDWEIIEVVDPHAKKPSADSVETAEKTFLTDAEHEWILRGAAEIELRGGRTQLALLLKGSRDKSVLKHGLDRSAVYGKLSFLTIEEIENRIDDVIRKDDLGLRFVGDLPLIFITDQAWERVRPWANAAECAAAAAADDSQLKEIVIQWQNRQRDERNHLLDAVKSLSPDAAQRILTAWQAVSGKEMRARMQSMLDSLHKGTAHQ